MNIKPMTKLKILLLIMTMFFSFFPSVCHADNFFDKLRRGIVNTVTGWVEIPKGVIETSKEENLFKGLTVGLAKGIGCGLTRTAVGLCETTTFIAPIPKKNYEAIITPEHVFEKEQQDNKNQKKQ
ncbi:MAG: exosortase system-associated protein, TIGR04073 family [Candidatus Omnitrophota bacterium]